MSRILGFQNDVLQIRRNGSNNNNISKKEQEDSKDDEEKKQITDLLHKLPRLDKIFEVHKKIGEGTFSSVFLGSLRRHSGLPDNEKRWYAIKHLVPTAHPARIEQELRCLQEIGGKDHVIGVDLCLRHLDTVVFVMPYLPHRKFSEVARSMCWRESREYLRALLIALRRVHSHGVIHRDVKPANFLYDRATKRYRLVDFGLAQRVIVASKSERTESSAVKRVATESASNPARPVPKPVNVGAGGCACAGVNGVCAACGTRPAPRAPRAGTQGFRPPEVLLKCVRQTTRVDIWAAGVVGLSVLSAKHPFFRASADLDALAEVTDLLGSNAIKQAAAKLGRNVLTSCSRRGVCLRKLCARLRELPPVPPHDTPACTHCRLPETQCVCADPDKLSTDWTPGLYSAGHPDVAFALVASLLQPNPDLRPSADQALQHPYFIVDDH